MSACFSLIDPLQIEVRDSPAYVANDEVDRMMQDAADLLDPVINFDWLEWGLGLLPRTQAAYESSVAQREAARRAEAERKADVARQLKELEESRSVKRQTSRSSRLGSADGAASPEQVTKPASLKRGRNRRSTVTAGDVPAATKGKSKAGKGKVRAAADPQVSLLCPFSPYH